MAMKRMGPPRKLTEELIKQAEKLLLLGNYETTVCEALNIDRSTWYRWKEQGEMDIKEGRKTLYATLCNTIKSAQSKAIARHVANILKASEKGSWQASAWFLERKYPELWGKKERIDVEGNGFELHIKFVGGDDENSSGSGDREDMEGSR